MIIKDESLLDAFRHSPRCEFCGRSLPQGTDPHHYWFKRGMGGGGRLDVRINLIALCRGYDASGRWVSCHDGAESGAIKKEWLLARVARREGLDEDEVLRQLNRLRRLDKDSAEAEAIREALEENH